MISPKVKVYIALKHAYVKQDAVVPRVYTTRVIPETKASSRTLMVVDKGIARDM